MAARSIDPTDNIRPQLLEYHDWISDCSVRLGDRRLKMSHALRGSSPKTTKRWRAPTPG